MSTIKPRLRRLALALMTTAAVLLPSSAQEDGGISLARDAETEAAIRTFMAPIIKVAKVDNNALGIYLVTDPHLNAFVAEGQNVFIHFGLLLETDNVNQVLGVLAHETGHITGGHLAQASDNMANAGRMQILGLLLAAAAMAAGSGDAGMGLLSLSQSMAIRTYLSYSRVQEASADQAGARFLDEAGISGRGMIEVFDKFRDQEYINQVRQDPYVRSHPLSGDRIARLEERVSKSKYFEAPSDPKLEDMYRRIKAKVMGYALDPRLTFQVYPESDNSLYARYAHVYAYNKMRNVEKALATAQSLIDERPDDPYFHEIKAQIYFENGRAAEAVPHLRKANELLPNSSLLMTSLGQALSASEQPETDAEARDVLEAATRAEPDNGFSWYLLGVVAARLKDMGLANLATAEQKALTLEWPAAAYYAREATKTLPKNTPRALRAQDIAFIAEGNMDKERGKRQMNANVTMKVSQ